MGLVVTADPDVQVFTQVLTLDAPDVTVCFLVAQDEPLSLRIGDRVARLVVVDGTSGAAMVEMGSTDGLGLALRGGSEGRPGRTLERRASLPPTPIAGTRPYGAIEMGASWGSTSSARRFPGPGQRERWGRGSEGGQSLTTVSSPRLLDWENVTDGGQLPRVEEEGRGVALIPVEEAVVGVREECGREVSEREVPLLPCASCGGEVCERCRVMENGSMMGTCCATPEDAEVALATRRAEVRADTAAAEAWMNGLTAAEFALFQEMVAARGG
jgi:hypothetical protein